MSHTQATRVQALPLPALADQFLLDPTITFLNHGSFGACPRPVFEEYQRWQRELERDPVDFLGRRVPTLLTQARETLAAFVGTQADNLVFVPNATYGVNVVARSVGLQPGDEVLATDHEYGAVNNTWRYLCEKVGARYINQPIPLPVTDAESFVEALWQGVTPRTQVIAISHITSPTALIFPVEAVCRLAREAGIVTVIDGAHALGQVDLDLTAMGATFYTGNAHKWLCAPKGAAFLYADPAHQPSLEPLVVSHGWSNGRSGSRLLDYFSWTGTMDPSAYLSVPAAIRFQREHDWPAVRAACHALASQARAQIQALTGLPAISPDSPAWFAQMFTARLPEGEIEGLSQRLWEEHRIEVPIFTWNGQPMIRVSIQAYNGPQHVEHLLAALTQYLF
ncbi:aminotransferase class V [Litorilinea aerophila]|nr:aminotransferase class V [Litorilinea aerophila]